MKRAAQKGASVLVHGCPKAAYDVRQGSHVYDVDSTKTHRMQIAILGARGYPRGFLGLVYNTDLQGSYRTRKAIVGAWGYPRRVYAVYEV